MGTPTPLARHVTRDTETDGMHRGARGVLDSWSFLAGLLSLPAAGLVLVFGLCFEEGGDALVEFVVLVSDCTQCGFVFGCFR